MWAVKNRSSEVPANRVDVGGRSEGEVWSMSATSKHDVSRGWGIYNSFSSAVLERIHSGWVVAGYVPRNFAHAHTPAFLAGLLS